MSSMPMSPAVLDAMLTDPEGVGAKHWLLKLPTEVLELILQRLDQRAFVCLDSFAAVLVACDAN